MSVAKTKDHRQAIRRGFEESREAHRVVIRNDFVNPIPVDPTTRGEPKHEYNESTVAALATGTLIDFTVSVGKGCDLTFVECSGDNLAHYIVEVNGSVVSKKRTWWTAFNADFRLNELNLTAGDNVKIITENESSSTAFFNATLYYNEYDL